MTAGIATTLANSMLSTLTASEAFVKLHTGDPGSAGTANASANTTRVAVTWASPSGASISANGTLPSWASWASGSETITHISYWSLISGGVFQNAVALSSSKSVTNGDTLNLTALSHSIAPIAA